MKIKDLPQPIKELALKRQIDQGNKPNEKLDLMQSVDKGGFKWRDTPEKHDFWNEIYKGNFDVFYYGSTLKIELNKPLPNEVKELIKAYNTTNELKQIAVDLELPETTLLSLVGKRNYNVARHNLRVVTKAVTESLLKCKYDLKKLEKITIEIKKP